MISRFDAAFVGAGPAGAFIALRLARMGWRIAVIERGQRFRTKTCGHCLNPAAFSILDRAGLLDAIRAMAAGTTHMLRVHLPQRQPIDFPLVDDDSTAPGLIVPRHRLDQFLIDAAALAGAQIFQPASAKVRQFSIDGSTIDITCESHRFQIQASLIIGADGVGSAVARAAGLADGAAGRKYGFSFDIAGKSAVASSSGAIEMFIAPQGYLGMVDEGEDRLHVAALISTAAPRSQRDPWSFVRSAALLHDRLGRLKLCETSADSVERFAAIGPMPWRPQAPANRFVALVGDAAGYIEPFTGEGMAWAIHSAETLADTLADSSPGLWNEQLARRYSRAWSREIGRSQCMCRIIAFGLGRRRSSNWMFRAGRSIPALSRRVVARLVNA